MKKLIALSAILSMSVAFAEDVVYGTFVLNSSEEQVVLCVPWVNPGSTDGAINVTDLIQTSTLETGDQLFYYENGGYKAWEVNDSKAWEAATSVSGIKITAPNGEETLTRGNAVILKRIAKNGRSNDIIINGQVGSGSATMKMARAEGLAYTLIAPANPDSGTNINSGSWLNVKKDDCIIIGTTFYYWSGEYWGTRSRTVDIEKKGIVETYTRAGNVTIPAGRGAWFMAQGNKDTVTTWTP